MSPSSSPSPFAFLLISPSSSTSRFSFPLLVTRGSKLAPDESLHDAIQSDKQKKISSNTNATQTINTTTASLSPSSPSSPSSSSSSSLSTSPHVSPPSSSSSSSVLSPSSLPSPSLSPFPFPFTFVSTFFHSDTEVSIVMKQLLAGGFAGCIARTVVAPIDRVKILMQTQRFIVSPPSPSPSPSLSSVPPSSSPSSSSLNKYSSLVGSLRLIIKEEGISRLWRGNLTNLVRVMPYSATQFSSYDFFKFYLFSSRKSSMSASQQLTTGERLISGALAAITATSITHPLDVIRLRLSVQKELKGFSSACVSVWKEGGMKAMFKGYFPTILSVSPFISINFACFDTLKLLSTSYFSPSISSSTPMTLSLGACAGIFAQTVCYPLDTIRRRMQLKGKIYNSTADAFKRIFLDEGIRGFYRGMMPNALKVVPNNAIRFMAYEWIKKKMGIKNRKGKGEGGGGGG